MCGIAGILGRGTRSPDQWAVLEHMSRAIAHRGPDGHGYFISGPVGLAHRRLSIIDIEGGRQPMINAAAGHALVYNGELYNFLSLRNELEAEGVACSTRSDTEVLLRLVRSESFDWVRRLNGMFAFALWDECSRQLVLGRDRLGIKPLYYATLDDEFVFASEIKGLLQHPRIARNVNTDRIPEHLAFRCVSGTETLFKGIHQVPPGHVMTVAQHDMSCRTVRFWPNDVIAEEDRRDPSAVRALVQRVLTDSVRRQLISDVPVGTYLSGGVDSSLITTLARPFKANEQLHTFSVGFDEKGYDESSFAMRVATQVGTTHHALVVTEGDYLNQLDRTVVQLDEPLNHAHTVQLQLLSGFAKSFVTVVLTGEGADELFAGYPRLHIPLLAKRLQWLPTVVSRGLCTASGIAGLRRVVKLLEASSSEREAVVHSARFVPEVDLEALYPGAANLFPRRYEAYDDLQVPGGSTLDRILGFDQRTYLPSLLSRLDKTSMAAAVECRVPFLDNEVIDCSLRVPKGMKIRAGYENKIVLKRIAATLLPRDLVYRRKVGFGTPLTEWLRNPSGLGRYLELLLDGTGRARAHVDGPGVNRLVSEHAAGTHDHAEAIWGLLSLELWHREVVDLVAPAHQERSGEWTLETTRLHPVQIGGATAFHSGLTV